MTIWVPDRRFGKATKATQFTSKVDGFRRSKRVWVCTACGFWQSGEQGKPAACEYATCAAKAIVSFPSKAEARRYAALRTQRHYGDIISEIEPHPRFPCVVNGKKVCTYIADFRYTTRDGDTRIEDVKGNINRTDEASKLRRALAEALHGISVKLVEA
jgi:hypothetical protein